MHPDARHILAMEPYYGGSHRAFLDGWMAHSRHRWTVLHRPARKWKWRMRMTAVDFAREAAHRVQAGTSWDLVFCSGMLDLATFFGLAPRPIRSLPAVVCFYENQLTYPHQQEAARDFTYGVINVHTALAASAAWFNTAYHLEDFLEAATTLLGRIPDHEPAEALEHIRAVSSVQAPGINVPAAPDLREPGPLRILWAARWEHDKNPETFFEGLDELVRRGVDFRVDVLGEQFRQAPSVFAAAKGALGDRIGRWGFLAREDYDDALRTADVFVSTAHHEFFGLAAVEAAAAGAFPVLPRRQAYPEVFQADRHPEFFYHGSAVELADRLESLAGTLSETRPGPAKAIGAAFDWKLRAKAMDDVVWEMTNDEMPKGQGMTKSAGRSRT